MFIAIALASSPTYLSCTFERTSKPLTLEATLDEPNQRATIVLDTGYMIVRPALFSPDRVVVPDTMSNWKFDRTDLTVQRISPMTPAPDFVEKGTCKLKPVPSKRAF